MSHLSYEGQTQLDYCLECALKHSQTTKVFMREALQRAEVDSPESEGVKEKIRGVVEELAGMEADTNTVNNESVIALNSTIRDLRKIIYTSKAEIGGAPIETLRDIKTKIDELVAETYKIREREEPCPTCQISVKKEETGEQPQPAIMSVAEKRKQFIERVKREVSGESNVP